ncbi:MAG: ABC transporter substrate-binding protein [Geobacteraceae bacterium]|nr:ABC transporter substrate-binding protein [Geobacteraceae bacterium]
MARFSLTLTLMTAFLLLFSRPPGFAAYPGLSPQEERGRQIYFSGTTLAGRPVTAYFGRELLEVPGELATCASCHGYDGLGRPESGVIPSNITWKYLMKSYGHIHPDGTEHPPFSEESLQSYMLDGVYPGGKQGDPSMPVYDIADQDLDDLIAYLKRLGTYLDPGLSESAIRIGTFLPAEGPAAAMGEAMKNTASAYFDEINEKGGIYGRKLELIVEKAGSGAMAAGHYRRFIEEKLPFAIVSPVTPGSERELSSVAADGNIPVVGPFTLFPLGSLALNRQVFYIYAGLGEQARALVGFAARNVGVDNPRIVILHPLREELAKIAAAAEEACRDRGWTRVVKIGYPPNLFDAGGTAQRLKGEDAELVIFLGGEAEAVGLLREAGHFDRVPYFFMPGALLGKGIADIPPAFKGRVYLAFPSLPEDRKKRGGAGLSALLKRHNLPVSHLAAQISAYAAARVLVEGLRLAGKDLSRELLITSLEKLYQFDTGLTPPITYGKNRRIGALGAYIVAVDPLRVGKKGFIAPQGWIDLD